jgi:uncharacterized Zn finger protein (UPF0148 family)
MSVLQSNCPSCGAPIEFKAGSTVVVVCQFCRSVVARTDRALEDLGKVAEIVQTQSPLKVGLKGKYLGEGFELTGRAQLKHEAGGVWDEWYATFSNGWVGWLAEAQGKFYLTFYQPLPEGARVPDFAALNVGQFLPFQINSKLFTVAEKGMATTVTAEGEIPYQLIPNETSYYADLSGADKAFATIDYGMNPPWTFAGQEVTLAEIGLADAPAAERKAPRVATAALKCPNCGGPLELRAPDAAQRVTCPNCDSLIDIRSGNLQYMTTLDKPRMPYALPIGAVANLPNREPMQVIGAMTRRVNIQGTNYYWQEYLLYRPSVGFRWLVHSDEHWSFVEPVAVGEVLQNAGTIGMAGATAVYNGQGAAKGKTFKIFQHATAMVEHIAGEFYWRVNKGENAQATDYVNAPFMLSKEVSSSGKSGEVNWSLGTYLTVPEVEKAFGITNLPRPYNIAPNQPFQYKGLASYGFALIGLFLVVSIFLIPFTGISSKATEFATTLPPMANPQASQIVFSPPFEIRGSRNVEIAVSAPLNNSWAEIDVDLVNEQNNNVESVPLDIQFYSGTEGGERWSEGSQTSDATLSAVPAGKYTLRVEGMWGNWQQPQPVTVRVTQNVSRGVNFFCCLTLLAILPIFAFIWGLVFESRRWSESMFSTQTSDK